MSEYLSCITQLAKNNNIDIYLVGGAVRDYILGLEINDFDFVVSKKADQISEKFADEIKGKKVELDKKRSIYRVIDDNVIFDFSIIQGKSIVADLKRRDFTINSLAIPQDCFFYFEDKNSSFNKKYINDPLQGLKDLDKQIIRANSPSVFDDDPLRLLRAIRLMTVLDFNIESKTENLMVQNSHLLNHSSPERIRDELYKIFSHSNTASILKYMEEKTLLFSEIFPYVNIMKSFGKCKYHNEDIWTHSLYMLEIMKRYFYNNIFNYNPGDEVLFKFAAIFHDLGKIFTKSKNNGHIHFFGHEKIGAKKAEEIFTKLKFSNKEIKYIKTLIRYHMQPLYLFTDENASDKSFYQFYNKTKNYFPDICLLSAVDVASTRILNGKKEKLEDYFDYINFLLERYNNMTIKAEEPLLNGKEVMKIMNVKEGPKVGEVLEKLKEAQALNKINTVNEAKKFVKSLK